MRDHTIVVSADQAARLAAMPARSPYAKPRHPDYRDGRRIVELPAAVSRTSSLVSARRTR